MKQLRGYDWDLVLVNADGSPNREWISDLMVHQAAGDECVILTCNTDPDHVRAVCRAWFKQRAPVVHRFKRSDPEGKGRWLAENRGDRKAVLIDDRWQHIEPAHRLGVDTIHVGGKRKQS